MDLKLFFAGILFLLVGLLMLNSVRKDKPASNETNGKGMVLSLYIQFWGGSILFIIMGVVFVLKAF